MMFVVALVALFVLNFIVTIRCFVGIIDHSQIKGGLDVLYAFVSAILWPVVAAHKIGKWVGSP